MTLATDEFINALIYQENDNVRKIRSGLGYYMNIDITISGSTVTYTYKLRDDLSFGKIDAMKTQQIAMGSYNIGSHPMFF